MPNLHANAKANRANQKRSATKTAPSIKGPDLIASSSETANARAYAKLRQAVLSGAFRPGDIVTLRVLTETLSLGDMAAREAIKRLISEGAFEALPNRSARIPVLDKREIQQLCELRILLEAKAAYLAANNITVHQINELRAINEEMKVFAAKKEMQGYKQLNMAFHFGIYRIADNKPLASLIGSLWLRMAPFISRIISWSAARPGRFEKIATSHHDAILDAFHKRDADAARSAMEQDLADIHAGDAFWDTIASQNTSDT